MNMNGKNLPNRTILPKHPVKMGGGGKKGNLAPVILPHCYRIFLESSEVPVLP